MYLLIATPVIVGMIVIIMLAQLIPTEWRTVISPDDVTMLMSIIFGIIGFFAFRM